MYPASGFRIETNVRSQVSVRAFF